MIDYDKFVDDFEIALEKLENEEKEEEEKELEKVLQELNDRPSTSGSPNI